MAHQPGQLFRKKNHKVFIKNTLVDEGLSDPDGMLPDTPRSYEAYKQA